MIKNLYNLDCIEGMKILPNESVDIILTDPPYKYLKNQKLEVDFDETEFFNQVKRVLKKGGFIVLFGRGTSFYRWNYMLSELGLRFKEEIIWDKLQISSPLNAILRVHETISIYCKGKGSINKVKLPFLEGYKHDPVKIEQTLYRLTTTFGNPETFKMVQNYFNTGFADLGEEKPRKFNATIQTDIKKRNRTLQFAVSFMEGVTEKTIMKESRDSSTSIHPTQKPVRLLERLLKLVMPPKAGLITVIDPFSGSFSTCEAVENISIEYPEHTFTFYGWEIDKEYYDSGVLRLNNINPQLTMF